MRLFVSALPLAVYLAVGRFYFQSTLAQIILGGLGVMAGVVIYLLMRNDDEAVDP